MDNTTTPSGISVIENAELRLEINSLGAELFSLKDTQTLTEYMWWGDESYWRSRSPILFPIVGRLCDNTLRVDGKEYTMAQHGLARLLEFEVVKHTPTEIVYSLSSNEESKLKYPYDFTLEIGYRLEGRDVVISYNVINPSSHPMPFQLGAHPGFCYMNYDEAAPTQAYFEFGDVPQDATLEVSILNESGYLIPQKSSVTLQGQRLAITKDTFNDDALVLEGEQTKDIALLDSEGRAYLRVKYDAPVVGLWSKARGQYAPFVCIEPWYGRCDRVGYEGEFAQKEWMQILPANDTFSTSIVVTILER